MQVVKLNNAVRHQNSETCTAFEYEVSGEKDINGAVIELDGRYPESGLAVNDISKELAYTVDGSGTLTCGETTTELSSGDLTLIQPGEAYYFTGKLRMFISSSPAWYPEQHRNINS